LKWRLKILGTCLLLAMALSLGTGFAQEAETSPFEELKDLQDQAKKLGAKSHLPMAWRQLDSHLGFAEDNGATDAQWEKIREEATLLLNQAEYLDQIRKKKNHLETLLGRFDQALLEIASLHGLKLDPVMTGSPQAEALLEQLTRRNLTRQVAIDSLSVANRQLNEMVGGKVATQDSLITALTVEIRSLRQKLWETELRVGVAEADRSAAETVLTSKQARESALASLRSSLAPEEGEILMTGDRIVVMRLHGISFAVGSSQLQSGQDVLLAKIADGVSLFPGARIQVEGHTDDTGSRDANLRLSRRRAETVARTLEKMLGMQENPIATEGFGPDRPVALNNTPEGRARNRRIDLVMELPE
jgi:OmpA-OmpF porin, OOP family